MDALWSTAMAGSRGTVEDGASSVADLPLGAGQRPIARTTPLQSPSEEAMTVPPFPSATPLEHTAAAMKSPSNPVSDNPQSSERDGSNGNIEDLWVWRDTLRLGADMREACGDVPAIRPGATSRYGNLIIVGAPGSGKSTFSHNMAALLSRGAVPGNAQQPSIENNEEAALFRQISWESFEKEPQLLRRKVDIKEGQDGNISSHYILQDTPGLLHVEHLEKIKAVIRGAWDERIAWETSVTRTFSVNRYPDNRFYACIYFIGPHSLGQDDVKYIFELSQLLPVVPVLAKADAMTPEEREDLRQKVQIALLKGEEGEENLLGPLQLESALATMENRIYPPYAVMGSTVMDPSVAGVWPIRKYPWGTVQTLSSCNSDVLYLKKLLFYYGTWPLQEQMEKHYYAYRQRKLTNSQVVLNNYVVANAAGQTAIDNGAVNNAQPPLPDLTGIPMLPTLNPGFSDIPDLFTPDEQQREFPQWVALMVGSFLSMMSLLDVIDAWLRSGLASKQAERGARNTSQPPLPDLAGTPSLPTVPLGVPPHGFCGVPSHYLTPEQQHQAFLSRLLLMLGSFVIMCLLLF